MQAASHSGVGQLAYMQDGNKGQFVGPIMKDFATSHVRVHLLLSAMSQNLSE